MSKSIMHDYSEGTCYLCKRLGDYSRKSRLEEHHVFGGNPNREHSEHYGLKVRLCVEHHRLGVDAVHGKNGKQNMMLLHEEGQRAFERTHTHEEFMRVFSRNYLEYDEIEKLKKEREEMNKSELIGRLIKDPITRYIVGEENTCISRFMLAVDRKYKREGAQTADFISIVAFGKTGEFVEKYFKKGMKVAVVGRIQTGKYEKSDGTTVYTTEVVAEEVDFCESKGAAAQGTNKSSEPEGEGFMNIPDGLDEELPFM